MPLVAEGEEDRYRNIPPCKYRSFFNTGETTVAVCENIDAWRTYSLKPIKAKDDSVTNFLRSFEVRKIPNPEPCRGCRYQREK